MFKWGDFLALAERLAQEADDESAQRTAIGRAYYAAYHEAAAYVRATGLVRTRHSHEKVWAALADDPASPTGELAAEAERLRRRRIAADYRNPFPGDAGEEARAAVAEARAVIEGLRRLP